MAELPMPASPQTQVGGIFQPGTDPLVSDRSTLLNDLSNQFNELSKIQNPDQQNAAYADWRNRMARVDWDRATPEQRSRMATPPTFSYDPMKGFENSLDLGNVNFETGAGQPMGEPGSGMFYIPEKPTHDAPSGFRVGNLSDLTSQLAGQYAALGSPDMIETTVSTKKTKPTDFYG